MPEIIIVIYSACLLDFLYSKNIQFRLCDLPRTRKENALAKRAPALVGRTRAIVTSVSCVTNVTCSAIIPKDCLCFLAGKASPLGQMETNQRFSLNKLFPPFHCRCHLLQMNYQYSAANSQLKSQTQQ